MIIEVAKVGTQLAASFGVTRTVYNVLPRVIPETADIATKACYTLAGLGVSGAAIKLSNDHIEDVFGKLEESTVTMMTRKEVKAIKEKKYEELVKAETEEEIINIIVATEKEIEEVKKKAKEAAEEAKKAKKIERERKRNLGSFYKKASKKLEAIKKVEDK